MKTALIVAVGSLVLVGGVFTVALVLARNTTQKPLGATELSWLASYSRVARSSASTCRDIPRGSTDRIARLAEMARAACAGKETWRPFQHALSDLLVSDHVLQPRRGVVEESHVEPVLGSLASGIAHRRVEVRCWSGDDWYHVNLERQAITGQVHFWASGLAEPGLVQLDGPLVCEPLARWYELREEPSQNTERARLATALVVLAHEAEHNRDFGRSEAEVECYAVQQVRSLVRDSGRSRVFAADIAAYAWDVSYIRGDPVYSTGRCRNKGPLDLHPASRAWP